MAVEDVIARPVCCLEPENFKRIALIERRVAGSDPFKGNIIFRRPIR
jgi:hypothetical protein